MENETVITPERKPIILVYAGRRRSDIFSYYEIVDNEITNLRQYKESLFKDKSIGVAFDCETTPETGTIHYSPKRVGRYIDFNNRNALVSEWRREDNLVEKLKRAEKEVKDIHKYESIRGFKKWYQGKSLIERQYILTDLVTFLNNNA